jgi:Mn-dependent DtxR family transcriptional regulator
MQASKKEDLLPVIFSMLQVSKDEVNRIKKARESLGVSQSQVKDAAKKGVFGMFKK